MAEISKMSVNGSLYDIKDETARNQIAEITQETVSGSVVRNGQTITITENLEGGGIFPIVIEMDDADFPISITANGKTVHWTWSGF